MVRTGTQRGFTLLEVLVALVIVALGLMAAFGQVNQTLTAANRLREKTIADWVAVDQMTKFRLTEDEFPAIGSSSNEVEMARTKWLWTAKVSKTDYPDLRQVDISVTYADNPKSPVATLTGFLSKPAAKAATPASNTPTTDWKPVPAK